MDGEFNCARWRGGRALLNQRVCRLTVTGDRLDERYLCHFLPAALKRIEDVTPFATVKHLSAKSIRAMEIPLPPIEEQRRIASIRDQAEELRAKRRVSLTLMDALNRSMFLDWFGDPFQSGQTWPVVSLAEVSHVIQIGPFGSLLHQHDYVVGGVPVLNPMHIVNESIVPHIEHAVPPSKAAALNRYRLRAGDILMARRGAMGRCAIVDTKSEGMLCGSGSLLIRPNLERVTVRYIHQVLTSSSMKRHLERKALGVTMANLNAGIVGALPISLPPIGEQQRFEKVRLKTARERGQAERSLALLDGLISSLQHRAFAGQL